MAVSGFLVTAAGAQIIPPGIDCLETVGGNSWVEFGGPSPIPPLPADFFFPGSLPFEGRVHLRGDPLPGYVGSVNTLVQRKTPADLSQGSAQVPIEFIDLRLTSVTPIVVYDALYQPYPYSMDITLNPDVPSAGMMMIIPGGTTGGTFTFNRWGDGGIDLYARAVFTAVGDPGTTTLLDLPVLMLESVTPQPWQYEVPELVCFPDNNFFPVPGIEIPTVLEEGLAGEHGVIPPRLPDGCCLPWGECINIEPDDCLLMGGQPQGVLCTGMQVPCCLPDGTCMMVDQLCCDDLNGWVPPVAQCLGDLNGNNIDDACETGDECEPEPGGQACLPAICPVAEEQCVPVEIVRSLTGGMYIADCECQDPFACHVAMDGPEVFCVGDCPQGEECQLLVWQDPNGTHFTCHCVPAPTEACCFAPDGLCQDLPRDRCEALGGMPQGAGTLCTVAEACCLADGTCLMADPLCCDDIGGTAQGPDTGCIFGTEACCLPDGTCVDVDPICCDDLGGITQGPGTRCTAAEACCFTDGTCLDVDPLCCDELGGTPQGAGTGCVDMVVPCCLNDGTCINTDPLCCDEAGGWIGYTDYCLGDLNGNGIDDACEEPTPWEPKWSQRPQGPNEGFDAASDLWWHEGVPHTLKWSQPPDPEWPGLHAHEYSDVAMGWITLADDWQCQGGDVTDLHWWGNYEMGTAGEERRGSGIAYFRLSIHECGGGVPWCLPGMQVWGMDVPFTAALEIPTGMVNIEGSPIYRYDFTLPEPFPQIQGIWYWFDVTAFANNPLDPPMWRWQEARRGPIPPLGHAPAARRDTNGPWQSIEWPSMTYSDLAFEVGSGTQEVNKVVADDFISDGRPIHAVRWWGSYLDPRYAPEWVPEPPYILDGWLLSFHWADLNADPTCPPDLLLDPPPTALGIYYAPREAVSILPLGYFDCFEHQVYRYDINLAQCCLLCSEPDPRSGMFPARPDAFDESWHYRYWLGIQAVVGFDYCLMQPTGHLPSPLPGNDGHFWGWHTGVAVSGTPLQEACTGRIADFTPFPTDCYDYGNWINPS